MAIFKRAMTVFVFSFVLSLSALHASAEDGGASPSALAPAEEKRGTFLNPVLKWQREFDPSLHEISNRNSGGEYLAVQIVGKPAEYYQSPARILFLNSLGETVRTIELVQTGRRLIKRDDVWLTFWETSQDNPYILRDFKDGRWITTVTRKAYVSGNGEYYGILALDDDIDSPWYEFSYYDRTGKLLWTARPQVNYFNFMVHISFDGSRVLIVDQVAEDIFGQKWYLFSREGKLLRTSTEDMPWIVAASISPNGEYIAYVTGQTLVLMDGDGTRRWEKECGDRFPRVFNNGMVVVTGLNVDKDGHTRFENGSVIGVSPDGKYVWVLDQSKEPAGNPAIKSSDGETIIFHPPDPISDKRSELMPISATGDQMYFITYFLGGVARLTVMRVDAAKGDIVRKDGASSFSIFVNSGARYAGDEVILDSDAWGGIHRVLSYDVSGGIGE